MTFLLSLLLSAAGISMIAAPHFWWEIEHFLTVRDGEPSDFYLITRRIAGGFLIAGAILFFILTMQS